MRCLSREFWKRWTSLLQDVLAQRDEPLSRCYVRFRSRGFTPSQSSDAFLENVELVKEKWELNDKSVTMSFYALYSRDYFEENMTLDKGSIPTVRPSAYQPDGSSDSSEPTPPACPFINEHPSVDRSYPGLEESIAFNTMQFKSYILSGALDLLYTSFRDSIPDFDVSAGSLM